MPALACPGTPLTIRYEPVAGTQNAAVASVRTSIPNLISRSSCRVPLLDQLTLPGDDGQLKPAGLLLGLRYHRDRTHDFLLMS
jgi:hypothetical protein